MQNSSLLRQWWRLGGYFGVAVIVTFVIGGVVQGESPTYDDPIGDIRAYWEDDGQAYLLGDYLFGLGSILFLVPFIACVRAMLARAEGGAQIWSTATLIGGTLLIAIAAAASASWLALAFGAEQLSDDALITLMYLDVGAYNGFPFGIAAFVLPASLVIAMTGVVWRWLGYLGIIVGIAGFIAPLGILNDDPEDVFDIIGFIFVFLGFAIWGLILSIGMIMMKEEPAPAEASAMA